MPSRPTATAFAMPPSPDTPPADMQTAEHRIQEERESQERSIEEAKNRLKAIEERTKQAEKRARRPPAWPS